jgi:hypothetical protein
MVLNKDFNEFIALLNEKAKNKSDYSFAVLGLHG